MESRSDTAIAATVLCEAVWLIENRWWFKLFASRAFRTDLALKRHQLEETVRGC